MDYCVLRLNKAARVLHRLEAGWNKAAGCLVPAWVILTPKGNIRRDHRKYGVPIQTCDEALIRTPAIQQYTQLIQNTPVREI